jgi:hypothetical protein
MTVTIGSDSRRLIMETATRPLQLDRAYATTSHNAHGLACDRALINAESSSRTTQRDVYYMLTTHARHQTKIFTNDAVKLASAINRLGEKNNGCARY